MSDAQENGLIFALKLDGKGSAIALDWPGVDQQWNDDEFVWIRSKSAIQLTLEVVSCAIASRCGDR